MGKNKGKKVGVTATAQPVKKEETVESKTEKVESKVDSKKVDTVDNKVEMPADPPVSGLTEKVLVQGETKPATVPPGNAQNSATVFQNAELQEVLASMVLTPETTLDANHTVELLTVATKRFETKDPRNPTVIAANEMLDELTCYCIAVAGVNMLNHGKKMGLSVPIGALPSYIRSMGYFGIALSEKSAVQDPNNPEQMIIPFEGVSKETEETIKKEITIHKSEKPTMDVALWKTEEDAQKAISYIFSDTLTADNRFLVVFSKVRMYKMLNAANEEEKKMWESASIPTIFETVLALLGDKKSTLLNAVGGQTYSAAATRKNPLLSHLTVRRNISTKQGQTESSDKDIAEIVKILIKSKAASISPDKPIEQNIAWLGLSSCKREDCLLIPEKSTSEDKELMNRVQSHYSDKIGVPSDKDYKLKATNFLVTIANLYKTDDFFEQYNETNYAESVAKALEAISGKTAPKDDKDLKPKEKVEDKKDKTDDKKVESEKVEDKSKDKVENKETETKQVPKNKKGDKTKK